MILKEQRTSGTLISLDHTPDLLKLPLLMGAAIVILVGFLSLRLTAAGKLGLSNLLPSNSKQTYKTNAKDYGKKIRGFIGSQWFRLVVS